MSHRPVKRTHVLAGGAVFAAALGLLHAGCGGDGSAPAVPPAPPPPQPLSWSDLPGEITVEVAETATSPGSWDAGSPTPRTPARRLRQASSPWTAPAGRDRSRTSP